MSKFFVYMKGLRGPIPQLWYNKPTTGTGQVKDTALFTKELDPSEENLTINQLVEKYPAPVVAND